MKHRVIHLFLLLAMLASLLSFTSTPAHAAGTIYVNTATDDNINNALCSLREAITAANTDAIFQGCPAGAGQDTILFAGDYTITLAGSQLPVVTTAMTIHGNGKTNTIVKANANPNTATYRVFEVGFNGNLTLDNLTIANGRCNGSCPTSSMEGGGIFNRGTLTITNSRISFNKADDNGGGIGNFGTLTISASTLDLNTAADGGGIYNGMGGTVMSTHNSIENNAASNGGGIYNLDGTLYVINDFVSTNTAAVNGGAIRNENGTFLIHDSRLTYNTAQTSGAIYNGDTGTITNSTLDNNSAQSTVGGAIYSNHGQLSITNSTFFGNSAVMEGGGISANSGSLDITNSTFAENTAAEGGGIRSYFSTTTLKNTLVANSPSGNDCHFEGGTYSADHYNIDTDGTCQDATQKTSAQVNLGPLANNEGPTWTVALLPGSHATDQGDPAVCAAAPVNNLDQRGVTRPQNTACDVGAFERILTFKDVPFDSWAWQFVESIYYAGITGGCSVSPLNYCPDTIVTRDQMAVFLLKGMYGQAYTPPAATGSVFGDVPSDYWAAAWIEQLHAEGITSGCGDGNYCPFTPVTRDQMAVFLLRAKYGNAYTPPTASGADFTDVPADFWAADWIEQLSAEGITGGCGGGNFCPSTPVSRDQMAVFLQATFNLALP